MSIETIRKDLERHAYDRLKQWERDTAERMRMASIPDKDIGRFIIGILTMETVTASRMTNRSPETIHRAVDICLKHYDLGATARPAARKSRRSNPTSSESKR